MKKQHPILFSTEMVKAVIALIKTMTRRLTGLDVINKNPDKWKLNQFEHDTKFGFGALFEAKDGSDKVFVKSPYGAVGDVLYVRENWQLADWDWDDNVACIRYADGEKVEFFNENYDEVITNKTIKEYEKLVAKEIIVPGATDEDPFEWTGKKQPFNPNIHLPKYWSRLWLEITDIRVERLQNISEEDARAEGVKAAWEDERGNYWYDTRTARTIVPHAKFDYRTGFKQIITCLNGDECWQRNEWTWAISFKVIDKPEEPKLSKGAMSRKFERLISGNY